MREYLGDRVVAQDAFIRKTRSVCPSCMQELNADILCKDGVVVMQKHCPEHGDCSVILSREVRYYSELARAYFAIMPKNMTTRFIAVTLTPRCTLNCPVCFAVRTIGQKIREITTKDLEKMIAQNPGKEFLLWGMEPTEHPQIVEILSLLKKHKKETYALSNGLKLQSLDFLRTLRDSGLSHLYLQFEGFDDEAYKVIRGRALLREKMAVLKNLKRLDIPTSLEMVLAKGVNDDQISKVIDYAVENPFIKQVSFLPMIPFKRPDECRKENIVPGYHESLRLIEQKTGGRISLDKLRAFQKLMYVIYRFAKFRKCYNFMSFVLVRAEGGGYKTIDEFIDLAMAEGIIDHALDKLKGAPGPFFYMNLLFRLSKVLLNYKTLVFFAEHIKFILGGRKLKNARAASSFLFITYSEQCDCYKVDIDMAESFCQEVMLSKNLNNELVSKPTYQVMIDAYGDLMSRS